MQNSPFRLILKWIDLPPVWLLSTLIASYWIGQMTPVGLSMGHAVTPILAMGLIGVGVILMLLAVFEMQRRKTTVIPHLEADHLVQTGIFRWTRNPIYLGDVLVLAGMILHWDAPLALPLVPVLIWVLKIRFIQPEEGRLRRKFGAGFDAYCDTTRRWL